MSWLESLKAQVEQNPIVLIRFSSEVWGQLVNSRRGVNEFTVALPHAQLDGVRVPAVCLIFGSTDNEDSACVGVLSSKSPVTTLESRIKVSRAVSVLPNSVSGLAALVTEAPHAKNLADRLAAVHPVSKLSSKLGSHVVERLASIQENKGGLRVVSESLAAPKRYRGIAAQQQDAVQTALALFGLAANDPATRIDLVEGKPTALGHVSFMEDSVVEHDARNVPGYSLVESDVTGRAVFEKGSEQLEIFTANRRDLEHCFGVDLIYINLTKQNVVMLQYKMLQPAGKSGEQTDWVYRPDSQLDAEIARMKAFSAAHPPGPKEYRLSPQVFYMKFVKRDASVREGGIVIPLDHFEKVRADSLFVGPKGGLRLSYQALNGSYLRQTPFLDLVKCGYVGAHATTTAEFQSLIKEILNGNKAIVAAVQQKVAA